MSLKVQIAVLSLLFAAAQAPAFAASAASAPPTELQVCYNEAAWPVTASPAYVYGGARAREQKRNGFNRAVYDMKALCYRMAETGAEKTSLANDCGGRIGDMLKIYGEKARTHAERTRDICQAMTGQAVTVGGI